jgi:chemotaxis protein MotB
MAKDKNNSVNTKPRGALFQGNSVEEKDTAAAAFMQLYASLMILLMTFFIVIYSYSTHSQAKFQMARQSLYKVFETLGIQETREIISFLKSKLPISEEKNVKQHKEVLISLAEISKDLQKKFGGAEVDLRRYQTTILLSDGKIFNADEVQFNHEATQILTNIVDYVKKDDYSQIIISAHFSTVAEGVQTAETRRKDWSVSSLRSVKIAQFLVEQGLNPELISAMGHGSTVPLVDKKRSPSANSDENNRIEIVIKKPELPMEEQFDLMIKSS